MHKDELQCIASYMDENDLMTDAIVLQLNWLSEAIKDIDDDLDDVTKILQAQQKIILQAKKNEEQQELIRLNLLERIEDLEEAMNYIYKKLNK